MTEGQSKSGREKDAKNLSTTKLRTSDTESKDCSSEVRKNISDESKKSTEGAKKCRDEGNNCQGEVNKNCSALYSGDFFYSKAPLKTRLSFISLLIILHIFFDS